MSGRRGLTRPALLAQRLLAPLLLCACAAPDALPPASTPPGGPQELLLATTTGHVYARSGGSGPDLVLLHGLGDSSVTWRKLEPQLRAAGYRVSAVDSLGAGFSDKPRDADYSLPAHVERLREVLDRLGIQRATLVGNSLGGSLALLFTLAHPERVRALVLIDPAAYLEGSGGNRWFFRVPVLADLGAELLPPDWIAREGLKRQFGDPARITAEDQAVYEREASRYGALEAFVAQERQVLPSPEQAARWEAGLHTIRQPVLLFWGTQDKILPLEHGRRLSHDLPDVRYLELEGVGHTAQMEAPERVLAETLAFLEQAGI